MLTSTRTPEQALLYVLLRGTASGIAFPLLDGLAFYAFGVTRSKLGLVPARRAMGVTRRLSVLLDLRNGAKRRATGLYYVAPATGRQSVSQVLMAVY